MSQISNFQMINPPNRLKVKVPQFGGAKLQDIVAETAAGMEGLADEYRTQLLAIVADMKETLAKVGDDPTALVGAAADILRGIVNMKGEAVSYGYPLISQIAAAFQVYLDKADPSERKHAEIIAAHLGAIEVVLAKNLKDPAEGDQLLAALEGLIAKALARSAKDAPGAV